MSNINFLKLCTKFMDVCACIPLTLDSPKKKKKRRHNCCNDESGSSDQDCNNNDSEEDYCEPDDGIWKLGKVWQIKVVGGSPDKHLVKKIAKNKWKVLNNPLELDKLVLFYDRKTKSFYLHHSKGDLGKLQRTPFPTQHSSC